MKKAGIVIALVFITLLVLSMVKDAAIKIAVEKGVEAVAGLKLTIKSLGVGIIRTAVNVKGLLLFNPAGFTDKVMIDMPEVYVDYDLPAIMRGDIHLRKVRLNLREFTVVKNADGSLNLNSLNVVRAQKEGKKAGGKGAGMPKIRIDELELKIVRAVYKDYSRSPAPVVTEFNLNIDARYSDIDDPYSLVSLIVVRALSNTTISRLSGFDLGGLNGTISDMLASTQKLAADSLATVKQQTGTAKEAVEALGEVFKNPFGGK